jgi:UDP-N-acetylglucosamine--N-acetylmuramyl-(pentapeptide) pyrophosphoryl-undecaprenol N-acetylglucosamine transferase
MTVNSLSSSHKNPTLLCIGGWSGWHILPIVILHDSLKTEKDIRVVWMGEKNSMDENKAKEHAIEFFGIPAIKFRRHFSLKLFIQPFLFLSAFFDAWNRVSKIAPDLVFCKWGWVALTVGIIARMKWIPIITHESDTVPWMTNTVIGKWSVKVFLWFPEAAKYFPNVPTEVVWQWIDPLFLEYANAHPFVHSSRTQVVVQCGGLWSTKIFTELLVLIGDFPEMDFTVALGTKNEHFYEDFSKFSNVFVKKWFFHEELAAAYAQADIGIVRAAANTLAECDVFGVQMIMIPLGIASFDHQTKNAESYVKSSNGFHLLLPETNLSWLRDELVKKRWFKKVRYGVSIVGALPHVRREVLERLH